MSWFPTPEQRAREQDRALRELVSEQNAERVRQAAIEWVRDKWGEGRPCPYCGDATWRAGMPVELRRPPGAGIAAAVPITCANCGSTVLLDTTVMGLAPEGGE